MKNPYIFVKKFCSHKWWYNFDTGFGSSDSKYMRKLNSLWFSFLMPYFIAFFVDFLMHLRKNPDMIEQSRQWIWFQWLKIHRNILVAFKKHFVCFMCILCYLLNLLNGSNVVPNMVHPQRFGARSLFKCCRCVRLFKTSNHYFLILDLRFNV